MKFQLPNCHIAKSSVFGLVVAILLAFSSGLMAQTAYVTAGSGEVTLVDLSTGSVSGTIDLNGPDNDETPAQIFANSDNSQLATVNGNSISIIDPASNTETAFLNTEPSGASSLVDGIYDQEDDRILVINQETSFIFTYDPNNLTGPTGFGGTSPGLSPSGIALNPSDGNAATSNLGTNDVSVLDISGPAPAVGSVIGVGDAPFDIQFVPGTDIAYTADFEGNSVSKIDVSDGTVLATIDFGTENPFRLALSPDGSLVAVVLQSTNSVALISNEADNSDAIVATIGVGANPVGVAFTPDGTSVVVVNQDDASLSIIDATTNSVSSTVTGIGGAPTSILILDAPATNEDPVAVLEATPTSGQAPLTVNFDATGSTDDGMITSFAYDFGNGEAGTGETTSTTYTEAGEFTVTLTVTDDEGATGTATVVITVTPAPGSEIQDAIDDELEGAADILVTNPNLPFQIGGITAAVVTEDNSLFSSVFGNASAGGVAFSPEDRIGLSDVSQTVLAALTLALEADGVLSLDQTVGDYITESLTGVPAETTIAQLLAHTSGIQEFSDDDDYESTVLANPVTVFTPQDLLDQFLADEPAVAPGTFSYANTNYLVLGLILEAANGEGTTLQESLDQFISTPAGLSGLEVYPQEANDPDGLAPLFADQQGTGILLPLNPNTSVFTGASFAGNLLATPAEVVQLARALDGTILSEEDFARLLAFLPSAGRISEQYGLGIESFTVDLTDENDETFEQQVLGHVGSINYNTTLLYVPTCDIAVFVGTNNAEVDSSAIFDLAVELLDIILDEQKVIVEQQAPVADLVATPTTGVAPLEVSFDASGSTDADGNIVDFAFDFGDGNTTSGTDAMVTNIYAAAGEFTATVIVTDNDGLADTASVVITVSEPMNMAPVADLQATPTSGLLPLEVNFDASESFDDDGNIVEFAFDFGDGNTQVGDAATAANTYATAGEFTATVIVTDDGGLTDTASVTIMVSEPDNMAPAADLVAEPTTGEAPLEVTFDASGSMDMDGTIDNFEFDFGDGNTTSGTDAMVTNTYAAAGTFTATVVVTDNGGLTDTASVTITVTPPDTVVNMPPTAVLAANPTSGTAPLTVDFDGSGSSDSDGTIVDFAFDFGDGNSTSGSEATATNTYAAPGTYTAVLTVTDDGGLTDSDTVIITVDPVVGEGVIATLNGPDEVPQGCDFPVVLSLETAETVGSFTVTLTFDTSEVIYLSDAEVLSDYTGVINDMMADEGIIIFNGARVEGQTGLFDIFTGRFQAVGEIGATTTIEVSFSALASSFDFRDLLPGLTINDYTFTIVRQGLLGDVNGDEIVNSTDALIILTFEVGNDVGPDAELRIAEGFGDVNGDGVTNSTDALIILTFDAGLPVEFPVGEETCPEEVDMDMANLAPAIVAQPKSTDLGVNVAFRAPLTEDNIVEVPVIVDMTETGRDLGSYGAQLTWNTDAYELLSYEGGTTVGFESPVLNDSKLGEGKINVAHAYVGGAAGKVNIFNLRLRKKVENPTDADLDIKFTSMAAAKTFESLAPRVNDLGAGTGDLNLNVFPNPFATELTIRYTLPTAGVAEVSVFNAAGQQVQVLAQGNQVAGDHILTWDGDNLSGAQVPAGMYMIQVRAGDQKSILRVVRQ